MKILSYYYVVQSTGWILDYCYRSLYRNDRFTVDIRVIRILYDLPLLELCQVEDNNASKMLLFRIFYTLIPSSAYFIAFPLYLFLRVSYRSQFNQFNLNFRIEGVTYLC